MNEIKRTDKNMKKYEADIEKLIIDNKEHVKQIMEIHINHKEQMRQTQTTHTFHVEELMKENYEKKEKLDDIEKWMKTVDIKAAQRDNLEKALNLEESKHQENLHQIKREKAIEIDKLRKEMLINIRQVKLDMLTQNEDQLQGTTKLTVKQNVQLSSELDY